MIGGNKYTTVLEIKKYTKKYYRSMCDVLPGCVTVFFSLPWFCHF